MKGLFDKILKVFGRPNAEIADSIEQHIGEEKNLKDGEDRCPYCKSKKFVKRGKCKKKLEVDARGKIFRLEKAWQKFNPPQK